MKVFSVAINNLLSFDQFELDLSNDKTLIVGPNGAGKSNVITVINLVNTALRQASSRKHLIESPNHFDRSLKRLAQSRHNGESNNEPISVRFEIEFTTKLEMDAIGIWFRAAVLSTLLQDLSSRAKDELKLETWVGAEITDEKLKSLYCGTIIIEHSGILGKPWEAFYEFKHGNKKYKWILESRQNSGSIVGNDLVFNFATQYQYINLAQALFEVRIGDSQPFDNAILDKISFDFSKLCPGEDIILNSILISNQYFKTELFPFRRAYEWFHRDNFTSQFAFTFIKLLSFVVGKSMRIINQPLRGLELDKKSPYPLGFYPFEDIESSDFDFDPIKLPLRLFILKTGSPDQQEQFKNIQKIFSELIPFWNVDLSFKTTKMSAIQIYDDLTNKEIEPDDNLIPAVHIELFTNNTNENNEILTDLPISSRGAGVWETLVIAEALAEPEGKFIIFDEPAISLHPTWQKRIGSTIEKCKNQILTVTHSPFLVALNKPECLYKIVRIENETGSSNIHRFLKTTEEDKLNKLIKLLSMSPGAVSLLFASAVILLEGETELGAFPIWFNQIDDLPQYTNLNIEFYSVSGDQNFELMVSFLHSFGILYVIVCDGAIFDVIKHSNNHILQQVNNVLKCQDLDKSIINLCGTSDMDKELFGRLKDVGKKFGIFTLALGWNTGDKKNSIENDESFEAFMDSIWPGDLEKAKETVGTSKVLQGAWLAENNECPEAVKCLYVTILNSFGFETTKPVPD